MVGTRVASDGRRWIARLLVAAVAVPAMAMTGQHTIHAAAGDCGFAGAVATFEAASGSWSTAGNWDTDAVPNAGPVCIPDGHTVTVGSGVTLPTPLRNQGTIDIAGTGVATGSAGLFDNLGTLSVGAGAVLAINLTASPTLAFSNGKGGVISVDGTVNTYGRFDNAGGTIATADAGLFNVSGSLAELIHGASSDDPPTQSIVSGDGVRVTGGKLSITGSGAGTFTMASGDNSTLTGNVRGGQTVNLQCDASTNVYVTVAANLRNDGTIAALPRTSGTCETQLNLPSGVTLTNAGTMTWGGAAAPTERFWLIGQGNVVNEAAGSIVVDDTLAEITVGTINDGSFTVGPGGTLSLGDSTFESRAGLFDNQGTVNLDRSSPTYTYSSVFRQRLGVVQGNPIRLTAGHVELLGTGRIAFEVPAGGAGNLRNPTGPVVIGTDQSFLVHGSLALDAADVENRGLITVDGSGTSTIVGSFGMRLSNRGRIVIATGTGTTAGTSSVQAAIINEPGAVVEAQPSIDTCALGQLTNRGLVDLSTSCLSQGVLSLAPTSIVRVRSSATSLTGLADLRGGSMFGGTLDIVTDALSPPPAGPPAATS